MGVANVRGMMGVNIRRHVYAHVLFNVAEMSILDIGPVVFGGTAGIIAFFQSKGVLARRQQCSQCGVAMAMQDRGDISDGCRWRCPNCHKGVSIRKGSFLALSKLTLQKWLILMHWWAKEYPVTEAAVEAKVSEPTAIQVYQWLREACSHRLCNIDPDIKLGGRGVVVAIDESLFFHKPKVPLY